MYHSKVVVPRMDFKTLAKLDKIAPGIAAFNGMGVIETEERALGFATSQLNDVLHPSEVIGGWSITETETGWDIDFRVISRFKAVN